MDDFYYEAKSIFNSLFHPEDYIYLYRYMYNREMNPAQYDSQIKFWSNLIKKWGTDTQCIEFSVNLLTNVLSFNTILPNLRPAIDFLVQQKIIFPKEEYIKKQSLISSISNNVFNYFRKPNYDIYVFSCNLKLKIQKLIDNVSSSSTSLNDVVLTKEEIKGKIDDDIDEELLFAGLNKTKCIKSHTNGYSFQVKGFEHPNRQVVNLIIDNKCTLNKIKVRLDELGQRINDEKVKAKQFFDNGNKAKALYCIKRRKLLENQETKLLQLHNHQTQLIQQFEQNEINDRVTKLYMDSSEHLKKQKQELLDYDDITHVLDDFDDIKNSIDEKSDIFSQNDNFDE